MCVYGGWWGDKTGLMKEEGEKRDFYFRLGAWECLE